VEEKPPPLKTGEKMKTATTRKAVKVENIFQLKTESLSPIQNALEKAHEIIKKETDAPRATITITRNTKGKKAHFTHYKPWKSGEESFNEIMFNADFFKNGAEGVLSTLIHEISHSINYKNGVNDCTSEQYHNKHFAKVAEGLGLKVEKVKRFGFALTTLTPEGEEKWAEALNIIAEALKITAIQESESAPKGRNKNLLVASCECGEKIRLSLKTLEKCAPICQACKSEFKTEEAEGDDN
jgi:hypothetical protein